MPRPSNDEHIKKEAGTESWGDFQAFLNYLKTAAMDTTKKPISLKKRLRQ